ncbi:MAG: penicillin-binding transpeptidase domain-containing protein, partial [Acidimicrobiales bacterium]
YDHKPSLANQAVPNLGALPLPQTTAQLHNFAGEVCGGQLLHLFTVSCDTGFGKLGLELGANNLYDEARSFGFDAVPPIDLPDPAVSNFPPPATFRQNLPTLAYSAIGQEDVATSPLEMAMVAGAIADRGTMMVPHVLQYVTNSQGTIVSRYADHVWKQATSPATAKKVTVLMESVVNSPGGTAPTAAIPGVEVAGKTGTAQTGTVPQRTDDWFVAFAPAAHPTIAVAVVLPDQPAGNEFQGGTLAAPIARAIIQSWLSAHPVKDAGAVVKADTGSAAGSSSSSTTSSSTTSSSTTPATTAPASTATTPPRSTEPSTTTATTAPPPTTPPPTTPATTGPPATTTVPSGGGTSNTGKKQ